VALEPSMATIPNAMLLAISTPYAKLGVLYDMHQKYFGKDDDEVLVWKAPTRVMNPTISEKIIERAKKRDRERAATEWEAEFRSNVQTFLSTELVDACVIEERQQLGPFWKHRYVAALDSAFRGDTFAIAIGHFDEAQEKAVLDVCEGFEGSKDSPVQLDLVIDRIAVLAKQYRFHTITGDQYAAEPIKQALRKEGVHMEEVTFSPSLKRDIYSNLKTVVNEGVVELLDNENLIRELKTLESRVTPSGNVQVGHPRLAGYHDDYATVCALVVRECLDRTHSGRGLFQMCDLT